MRHTVKIDTLPKFAIGQEVIDSAVRILIAAGFSDEEIVELFHSVRKGDPADLGPEDFLDDEVYDLEEELSSYDLREAFEKLEEVRALERLAKRNQNSWRFENEAEVRKAAAAVDEAIPLGEFAQEWLRDNASKYGLQIGGIRDEWIQSATDRDLDKEHEFVFFDDWQYSAHFDWRFIETLARHYAGSGNVAALSALTSRVSNSRMEFSSEIMNTLAGTNEQVSQFAEFEKFVREKSGQGEQMRSHLTDQYAREREFEGTYILDQWFDALASNYPEIEVYKRSNRWRVKVE